MTVRHVFVPFHGASFSDLALSGLFRLNSIVNSHPHSQTHQSQESSKTNTPADIELNFFDSDIEWGKDEGTEQYFVGESSAETSKTSRLPLKRRNSSLEYDIRSDEDLVALLKHQPQSRSLSNNDLHAMGTGAGSLSRQLKGSTLGVNQGIKPEPGSAQDENSDLPSNSIQAINEASTSQAAGLQQPHVLIDSTLVHEDEPKEAGQHEAGEASRSGRGEKAAEDSRIDNVTMDKDAPGRLEDIDIAVAATAVAQLSSRHNLQSSKSPGERSGRSSTTPHLNKIPILSLSDLSLDWAIYEPQNTGQDSSRPRNVCFPNPCNFTSRDQVFLKTPSGLKGGVQEGTGIMCTIRMGDDLYIPPQRVQVIALPRDGPVIAGECGSWAMNQDCEFTGMLIGSCTSLSEAYLLRMSDILEDIRERTGLEVRVAPTSDG